MWMCSQWIELPIHWLHLNRFHISYIFAYRFGCGVEVASTLSWTLSKFGRTVWAFVLHCSRRWWHCPSHHWLTFHFADFKLTAWLHHLIWSPPFANDFTRQQQQHTTTIIGTRHQNHLSIVVESTVDCLMIKLPWNALHSILGLL